jgi:hypothetical protein
MAFYTEKRSDKGTKSLTIYAKKHYRKGFKVDKDDFYYYNRIAVICQYPRSLTGNVDGHICYVLTDSVILHNVDEMSIEPAKTKGEYLLHFINKGERTATISLTGSKNNLAMLEDGLRTLGVYNL